MSRWTREAFLAIFEQYAQMGPLAPDRGSAKAKKRARIVDAATELFLHHGYRKTSVDEVARRSGVAKGTVYLYFKNKGELLFHAIAKEELSMMGSLEPLFTGEIPDEEKLRFWVKLNLASTRDMPLLAKLMSGDVEIIAALEDMDTEQFTQSMQLAEEMTAELIEMAAPGRLSEEQRRERGGVLMSIRYFGGLMESEMVRNHMGWEKYIDLFTDMMVHGVLRPIQPSEPEMGGR